MAKTAKAKKREVTMHSRAARRIASPATDLHQPVQVSATGRDSALPSRPSKIHRALATKSAGLQKKQKKKTMTYAQRIRHEKGLQRAEENWNKLELKRAKSASKAGRVRERARGWEDINTSKSKHAKHGTVADRVQENRREEKEWLQDEEMDGNDLNAPVTREVEGEEKQPDVLSVSVEVDEML